MRHIAGFLPAEVSRWKKTTTSSDWGSLSEKITITFGSQYFGHRTDESKGSNFVERISQTYINFCLSCSIL